MSIKLTDRISNYAALSNYKLLPKLPVVININGRAFSKITALLDKPYSPQFTEAMTATTSRLIQEIDGTIFAYIFNDEIVIVARNDQNTETTPWCSNDSQKMTSIVSAIATLHFNSYAASIELNVPEAILTTQVFVVPNITEAINTIIAKQQQNLQSSIQLACSYALLNKGHNKNDIKDMIGSSNMDEKIDLLKQECGIVFQDYAPAFRRGVALYKKPQVILFEGKEITKNKWYLDTELPVFVGSSFLQDILKKENT